MTMPSTEGGAAREGRGLPFSLFLALRYLKPKRTFVSIITLISIIGVMLGITVLILVISVMTGFEQELRRKVLGFDPHIIVTDNELIFDWREMSERLLDTQGVEMVAPFVQGPVIVEFQNRRLTPNVRGIDIEAELRMIDLNKFIKSGSLDLDGDKVVVGSELAENLEIRVGDVITLYSPNINDILDEIQRLEDNPDDKQALSGLKEMVLPTELTVSGIFESGRYAYDSQFLLVPIYVGQELYGLEDAMHGISVQTKDAYQAAVVKERILTWLPPPTKASTWIETNKQLFNAIAMERNVMFFLLFFIIIVAAFGIMNTLITVTVQKTREIGIMKAIGASTSQIVWVFLGQGIVVGFFGNVAGLILGMWLVRYRNEVKDFLAWALNVQIFPPDIYQFSQIPAEVVPKDVAIICISAFLICSLAALIPAWFAARLDPVAALRQE